MAVDDRPANDPVEELAALRREFDDLKATLSARTIRRPTGDIEPTLRATAKPDTLLLNGGVYFKSEYEALWQWAQDNGAVTAGFFKDVSSTSFSVPDFKGRVIVGAGTLDVYNYPLGLAFGFAKHTMTVAHMPPHTHGIHGQNHEHSTAGFHGHRLENAIYHAGVNVAHDHTSGPNEGSEGPGGPGVGAPAAHIWVTGTGDHTHGNSGWHQHGMDSAGSGTAFDILQPSIVVNWLIWT